MLLFERRRLPRRDDRAWSEKERNEYRAKLATPGPLMGGNMERTDPWKAVRS